MLKYLASLAAATFAFSALAAAQDAAKPTDEQMTAGKMQYMTVCFVCHQPTGLGLPPVFPPLAKSPYVTGSAERLVAMILKGNIGPFKLDGKDYNNIMLPQEAVITDDSKIAAVATYVRNSFGNSAPPVTTELVTATRKKFIDRKTQWTQVELDAWKEEAAK